MVPDPASARNERLIGRRHEFPPEKIAEGLAQLDRGEGIPGPEASRRRRERLAAAAAGGAASSHRRS